MRNCRWMLDGDGVEKEVSTGTVGVDRSYGKGRKEMMGVDRG